MNYLDDLIHSGLFVLMTKNHRLDLECDWYWPRAHIGYV